MAAACSRHSSVLVHATGGCVCVCVCMLRGALLELTHSGQLLACPAEVASMQRVDGILCRLLGICEGGRAEERGGVVRGPSTCARERSIHTSAHGFLRPRRTPCTRCMTTSAAPQQSTRTPRALDHALSVCLVLRQAGLDVLPVPAAAKRGARWVAHTTSALRVGGVEAARRPRTHCPVTHWRSSAEDGMLGCACKHGTAEGVWRPPWRARQQSAHG
jgi:hypothetical protein